MSKIFREFTSRFASANWNRVSTLMIEGADGVFQELKQPIVYGTGEHYEQYGEFKPWGHRVKNMWNNVWSANGLEIDESGLDSTGRDWHGIPPLPQENLNDNNNGENGKRRL